MILFSYTLYLINIKAVFTLYLCRGTKDFGVLKEANLVFVSNVGRHYIYEGVIPYLPRPKPKYQL